LKKAWALLRLIANKNKNDSDSFTMHIFKCKHKTFFNAADSIFNYLVFGRKLHFRRCVKKNNRSFTPVNLTIIFLTRLETEFFHPNN